MLFLAGRPARDSPLVGYERSGEDEIGASLAGQDRVPEDVRADGVAAAVRVGRAEEL